MLLLKRHMKTGYMRAGGGQNKRVRHPGTGVIKIGNLDLPALQVDGGALRAVSHHHQLDPIATVTGHDPEPAVVARPTALLGGVQHAGGTDSVILVNDHGRGRGENRQGERLFFGGGHRIGVGHASDHRDNPIGSHQP